MSRGFGLAMAASFNKCLCSRVSSLFASSKADGCGFAATDFPSLNRTVDLVTIGGVPAAWRLRRRIAWRWWCRLASTAATRR